MKRFVIISAVAAALAGCAIGPDYKRPDLDVPTAFRAQEETPSEKSIGDLAWWEVYQDKTLQELLRTALAQNRDVKIAAARVAEARAQVGVSRLAQLPQVDVAADAARGRQLQSGEYATRSLFTGQGEVFFEVDLWRRLASLSDAARANLLATEYARQAVGVSLISNVANAYFDLLALDQQYRITERTVASRERFLELTRSRWQRGVATALDVSRADANLAAARANLPDLTRQIALAENRLAILLGQNPSPIVRERFDLQTMPVPPDVPSGLPSALLERRPDLREVEASLAANTANVRAAKAALFPTISLTGAFGSQSLELSDLFSGPTKVWSVGLGFLQPILDANRNRYQVDAARAREEQTLLQYQNAVATAFREVADALAARRGFADFQRAQEQQVNALREASARVLKRYETGFSSYFEVIDADTSLFDAELQLVQAYRNNLGALVQLYQALGGGWEQNAHAASAPDQRS